MKKVVEEHIEEQPLILDEEECSTQRQQSLILDVNERPQPLQWCLLSFQYVFCVGKISALIQTIPNSVLGGMSILLYGVIASNGLRVLVD